MSEQERFNYDVFLSHSSRDREVVHALAERLKADGLRVWLDDWEIKRAVRMLARFIQTNRS